MSDTSPDPFADTFVAMIAARAIMTATELGIFDVLADDPLDEAELAARTGLDPVGTRALVTALISLRYLTVDGSGRLSPAPVAASRLTSSSPHSTATYIGAFNSDSWDALTHLRSALVDGTAVGWHERPPGDPFWETYIRALFELSRDEHAANAALLAADRPRTLVDVAGGHGGFAMALCRLHPTLRATVLELPASAAVGRRIVAEEGFANRIEFREGDLFEVAIGDGDADVVAAFNLIHHLAPDRNRELIRRAREALRPGGRLIIGDTERPSPDEPASQVGAMTGLLFYATSHAHTYTTTEVREWVVEAGFEDLVFHRNERSPWRLVLLARR